MTCPGRFSGASHCYHPTFTGPWGGITPPPMKCCFCGQSPAAEHGPFALHPWGYTTSGEIVGTVVYCGPSRP